MAVNYRGICFITLAPGDRNVFNRCNVSDERYNNSSNNNNQGYGGNFSRGNSNFRGEENRPQ
jgi:hypothetical protein